MALDKRQKMLLPLIILVFIYIAWQVYTLLAKESRVIQADTPHEGMEIKKGVSEAFQKKFPAEVEKQAAAKGEQPLVTPEQSEYLKLINRYNLLKLKHLLLEEEAAIAAAKQRIIKSRSEIASLGGSSEVIGEESIDLEAGKSYSGYELVYLDYQNGRWNALLNHEGRFFEIHRDLTIANGDKIINVGKEGVVVSRKGQLFLINFDGSRLITIEGGKIHINRQTIEDKDEERVPNKDNLPEPVFLNSKQIPLKKRASFPSKAKR